MPTGQDAAAATAARLAVTSVSASVAQELNTAAPVATVPGPAAVADLYVPMAPTTTAMVATAAEPDPGLRAGLFALLAGGDGGSPAAASLAWSVAAVSRRELGGAARISGSSSAAAESVVAADAGQPFVQRISLPSRGTYGTGTTMTFALNFSEPVRVADPTVTLPIQVGFAMRDAQYISGSGTERLVFRLTVSANDVGPVNIGRVSTKLVDGATAPVRIFDFNGVGYQQPPSLVVNPRIVDLQGNPVVETIPSVDTTGIEVYARGPGVVGYGTNGAITTWSGPLGLLHLSTLQVKFDNPVAVTGQPIVPVTFGGADGALTYTCGSGTSTLMFSKLSFGADPGQVSFYGNGQVIYLPSGSDIKDRYRNSAVVIRGDFGAEPGTLGPPLVENGNTMVVLGAHYEDLGTAKIDQLNTILTTEVDLFYRPSPPYTDGYQIPTYVPATHAVDLYRVAYASTIPEQGNRPTTAYGLVAIPQETTGPLPVMSYQHGTIVGKGEVPSQSFNWLLNPDGPDTPARVLYDAAYETRLNVAQFGGQGYAVIAADYFGVGNSIENDGYISKPSQQQSTLDLYRASLRLFAAKDKTTSDLFLGGWSQGGLVTVDFLEKLESLGIPVTGAATASAPANVQLTSNAWYFNPRPYTATETGDAPWLNVVGELSNFSITGYAGYPDSPLQMLGVNYEAARAMYMRQYDYLVYQDDLAGGIEIHRNGLAVVVLPYSLQKVIAPQYSGVENAVAFAQTDYGQLLASSGAGQTYLASNMQMYYGSQDEVIPVFAGTAVYDWQTDSFGKPNIAAIEVNAANHRGTFLSAVRGQLDWFNSLRS